MSQKLFKFYAEWCMAGAVYVEAETLEQAVKKAHKMSLPNESYYVENTFQLDTDDYQVFVTKDGKVVLEDE